MLGLGAVDEDELYAALDWLLERQTAIEAALAKRHLKHGMLVLYDVSSTYFEGRCCPLGTRGYNRDGKRGKLQIVFGLLCAADGCPVAVEVFEGNTGDPMTLAAQIDKLKQRFEPRRVVLVGDRGMITQARIEDASARPGSTGSPRCARRIRPLIEAGASSSRCSTSATWPHHRAGLSGRTPDRLPQSRSRRGAYRASARPARRHRARLASIADAAARQRNPLRGKTRSGSPSARDRPLQDGQALRAHHHRRRFTFAARPTRSTPRRRSTASMWCAPACRRTLDDAPASPPTKAWPRSSAPSAASRPSISRSDRSITFADRACAPTSFVHARLLPRMAHAPSASPRCSSTMPTRRPPKRCATSSSPRRNARPAARPNRPPNDHRRLAGAQLPQLLADLATFTRNTVVTASPQRRAHPPYQTNPIQQKAFDLLGVPV